MREIASIALIAALLSSGAVLFGQPEPNRRELPQAARQLNLLDFTLGKSTLDDVRARLGDSKTRKCSREEEASNEICYVSAGPDRTKVVFMAGFSGGWTQLDGYKIVSSELHPECYRLCSPGTFATNEIRTPSGLRLGLTRQEVMRVMGKPTHSRRKQDYVPIRITPANDERRDRAAEQGLSVPLKNPYWNVLDTVYVVLANGIVVELEVLHTVSY